MYKKTKLNQDNDGHLMCPKCSCILRWESDFNAEDIFDDPISVGLNYNDVISIYSCSLCDALHYVHFGTDDVVCIMKV